MDKIEIINKIKNELNNIDKKTFDKKIDSLSELAKENEILIVYGYSDDCVEFDGAIIDELSCGFEVINTYYIDYKKNGKSYIVNQDIFTWLNDKDGITYTDIEFIKEVLSKYVKDLIKVKAGYCTDFNKDGWGFELELPESMKIDYDTFNILEDAGIFIKGLIIDLESFKKAEA